MQARPGRGENSQSQPGSKAAAWAREPCQEAGCTGRRPGPASGRGSRCRDDAPVQAPPSRASSRIRFRAPHPPEPHGFHELRR